MTDFIVIAVVLVIVGAAMVYIRNEKKNGIKCIGCPNAVACAQKNNAKADNKCSCHTDVE